MNKITDFLEYFSFNIHPFIKQISFPCGGQILMENSLNTCLYFMTNGRAKVYKTHKNGKVSIIEFLNAPAFVGELELIGVREEAIGVKAIAKCDCFMLSISECKEMLLNDPVFLNYLCKYLGKKTVLVADQSAFNQSYPLSVRLANFILCSQQNGIYLEKHTEAAEYLGVSYRHLLNILADFVKRGILQKASHGYRITDGSALQKIADYTFTFPNYRDK